MTEHKHHKHKRAQVAITEVVTEVKSATYELQEVIIYVDDSNVPVSNTTLYKNQVGPTKQSQVLVTSSTIVIPKQAATSPPVHNPAPIVEQKHRVLASDDKPMPAPKQDSPSQQPSNSEPPAENSAPPSNEGGGGEGQVSGGPGFALGVTYTPYNADHSCKSESQVAKDLADVKSYQVIRIYGTDCNQVANVIKATKGTVSIFAGIFNINNVQEEVNTIASAVNGNWKLINTVSVGNELVNNGKASVNQVTSAIDTARSALKAKGYNGPVVTVDTMMAMKNNPQLCHASDFCAINCHAFFDGSVLPSDAGPFVADWAKQVSHAAGGKTTVVTESGWPTKGYANKKAVPSQENHQKAMQSLNGTFSENLVMFGLYNELWKQDSGVTHGAERYWGILGNAPSY